MKDQDCASTGAPKSPQKVYLRGRDVSGPKPQTRPFRGAAHLLLAQACCVGMYLRRPPPGMQFRWKALLLAARQLMMGKERLPLLETYGLMVYPLDSVRYFEFDFAWKAMLEVTAGRYLDVSSPRLLPILFLKARKNVSAVLENPDRRDLPLTRQYASAARVSTRCDFSDKLIGDLDAADGSFDLITCISVLEHIPLDTDAVARMWALLRPGGRLILTVPCAAQPTEEYVDENEYQILEPSADGRVFWQRYYDREGLDSRIFSVTGMPAKIAIYGELQSGTYARNVQQKMHTPKSYPYWREPHFMATNFGYFSSIDKLPGMGVAGMEFVKS